MLIDNNSFVMLSNIIIYYRICYCAIIHGCLPLLQPQKYEKALSTLNSIKTLKIHISKENFSIICFFQQYSNFSHLQLVESFEKHH